MVDRIKLKVAKAQANYRIHLEGLQQAELILSINDPNNLTAWQLTGSASFVGAYWSGNRITRMIIKDEDDGEAVLTPPRSQVAPVPPNIHPELRVEILMHKLSTIELEFSTNAEEVKQEITLVFRLDIHPDQNILFKADCILPADRTSATLMSFVAPLVTNELLGHLLENALYYSQAIWMDTNPGTLAMQLSDYQFNGKRLIEYIDPSPLSTAGNFLVFRWKDEGDPEWQEWKEANVDQSKVGVDLVSLPTGGVFAEAVLGRFNSAEKLDITRFWNWQDSPIPIQAPEIAAIQAGQHQISGAPQTGSLEAPIINIQTPQSLPDPTGMSSIISALTAANMFRDMSGAAQTAALAQAALQSASQGASSAMTQAGANMATAGQFQVEMTKALLPLIGAAMGIPVPPSPGTSNITNAGAAINHGAKMDAKSGGSNGVNGDTSSGGSNMGGPSGRIGEGSGNPPGALFASNRGGEAEAFSRTIGSSNVSDVINAGLSNVGASRINRASRVIMEGDGVPAAVVYYLQNPVFDQPVQNRFGQILSMSTGDFFGERLILWPRASDIWYLEGDRILSDRPDQFFSMLEFEAVLDKIDRMGWLVAMAEIEANFLISFTVPLIKIFVFAKGLGLLAHLADPTLRNLMVNEGPKVIAGLQYLRVNANKCLGCIVKNAAIEAVKGVPGGIKAKDLAYIIGRALFSGRGAVTRGNLNVKMSPLKDIGKAMAKTALIVTLIKAGPAGAIDLTVQAGNLLSQLQAEGIPVEGNVPCVKECLEALVVAPNADTELQALADSIAAFTPALETLLGPLLDPGIEL